jgi:predicted transcriptional regulator YheO
MNQTRIRLSKKAMIAITKKIANATTTQIGMICITANIFGVVPATTAFLILTAAYQYF